jgi:hypothetical protein
MGEKKVISLADKAHDSRMWTAQQMLEDLLNEIRDGEVKPKHMIILFWEETEEKRLRKSARCVNFTNSDYVAFLATAAHDAMHDWKNG